MAREEGGELRNPRSYTILYVLPALVYRVGCSRRVRGEQEAQAPISVPHIMLNLFSSDFFLGGKQGGWCGLISDDFAGRG